ncbi:hypothetical protein [Dietzia sp. ANT_WB102]|uniref:hypothetical protein n=1 Tax=Dietzia sp. ANT_WB102 TaxID=2597345 RepID=UPI002102D1D4|nr:hypothetical protein [Dietzia sp. ANT_WB102]
MTTPGRWRRRRTARIGLAAALVASAPFVDRPGTVNSTVPAAPPGAIGVRADEVGADGFGTVPSRDPVRVVPVPLADPAVADLLHPGDLVDLVDTAEFAPGQAPALVAHGARVRDVPAGRTGRRSLLVEVPEADAAQLAAIAAGIPLAIVVHG